MTPRNHMVPVPYSCRVLSPLVTLTSGVSPQQATPLHRRSRQAPEDWVAGRHISYNWQSSVFRNCPRLKAVTPSVKIRSSGKMQNDRVGQWGEGDNICHSTLRGLDRLNHPALNKVSRTILIYNFKRNMHLMRVITQFLICFKLM